MEVYVQDWKCSGCGLKRTLRIDQNPNEGVDPCPANSATGQHAWYKVGNPYRYC